MQRNSTLTHIWTCGGFHSGQLAGSYLSASIVVHCGFGVGALPPQPPGNPPFTQHVLTMVVPGLRPASSFGPPLAATITSSLLSTSGPGPPAQVVQCTHVCRAVSFVLGLQLQTRTAYAPS